MYEKLLANERENFKLLFDKVSFHCNILSLTLSQVVNIITTRFGLPRVSEVQLLDKQDDGSIATL